MRQLEAIWVLLSVAVVGGLPAQEPSAGLGEDTATLVMPPEVREAIRASGRPAFWVTPEVGGGSLEKSVKRKETVPSGLFSEFGSLKPLALGSGSRGGFKLGSQALTNERRTKLSLFHAREKSGPQTRIADELFNPLRGSDLSVNDRKIPAEFFEEHSSARSRGGAPEFSMRESMVLAGFFPKDEVAFRGQGEADPLATHPFLRSRRTEVRADWIKLGLFPEKRRWIPQTPELDAISRMPSTELGLPVMRIEITPPETGFRLELSHAVDRDSSGDYIQRVSFRFVLSR